MQLCVQWERAPGGHYLPGGQVISSLPLPLCLGGEKRIRALGEEAPPRLPCPGSGLERSGLLTSLTRGAFFAAVAARLRPPHSPPLQIYDTRRNGRARHGEALVESRHRPRAYYAC